MKKVKVTVSIADQLITLCGTEDEGYIEGVAAYVDTKMRELQRTNPALSTSACVMLAAVNITDELFKLRQQYAELDQRISELRAISVPTPPIKPPRTRAAKAPVKRPFEEVKA